MSETFAGVTLPEISDDFMRENLPAMKPFTVALLKKTSKFSEGDPAPIVWEHGRRNFSLHGSGLMPIVCPIRDDDEYAGICIFVVAADEAARIMDKDPGVRARIFSYEVYPTRTFPGSALPA